MGIAPFLKLNGNISSHKSSGDHDGRYYTETEVNNLLAGKSATSHSHAWSAITGKPGTFMPSDHNHDGRYFTESEIKEMIWNEISVDEFSVDNVSISPGPHTQSIAINKPGYWAVGVVLADVVNATSGGTMSSKCPIYGYGLSSQSAGYIRVRCWEENAKVKFIIKVLYWKDPR